MNPEPPPCLAIPCKVMPYEPRFIEAAAQCLIETFAQPPWNENWTPDFARERIELITCSPASRSWLLLGDRDEVLGALFGRKMRYLDFTELFVDELFISHRYQRQGLGRQLIAEVSRHLRDEGMACMVLNTERDYPSEQFYRNSGFEQIESIIMLYRNV